MLWTSSTFPFLFFVVSTRSVNMYGPPKEAILMERPFQAAILRNGQYHCSGTSISNSCVLTACSCIVNPQGTKQAWHKYSVLTNTIVISNHRPTRVLAVFFTKGCNEDHNDWNVAILCTLKTLPGTPVTIVDEPTRENVRAIVSGWGLSQKKETRVQNRLQRAYMRIIGLDQCRSWFNGLRHIPDSAICAVASEEVRGFCTGDIGGPLTHGPGLIGIAVTHFGCGRHRYPGLFINVSMLADQIDSIVTDFESLFQYVN